MGKVLLIVVIMSVLALGVLGFSEKEQVLPYRWTFGAEQDTTPSQHDVHLTQDSLRIDNIKDLIIGKVKDTRSMFPLIKPHAITLEKPVEDITKLQEGMIVTYRKIIEDKEEYIMHMIVAKKQQGEEMLFQMQGINNPIPDEVWVKGEDIISEFVGVINPTEN